MEFCQKHKRMEDHIKKGVVDFAIFSIHGGFSLCVDCEKDTELTLLSSGKKLSEETIKTPLIAISNYLFNGLREEAISISHGVVSEGCVTISTDREYSQKNCLLGVERLIIWIRKLLVV